jgi:hypothetical protein
MDKTGDTFKRKIDGMLARLGDSAPDRSLDQLEPHVWASIAARRLKPVASLAWEWRAALAAAALVLGAATGGAAVAGPPGEFAPFSAHADFLPSTLLGLGE